MVFTIYGKKYHYKQLGDPRKVLILEMVISILWG